MYYTAGDGQDLSPLHEQDLLLPPSLRDWLPEDHLAFFVSDLIDQLGPFTSNELPVPPQQGIRRHDRRNLA
jgi:hypothetical protein